MFKGKFQIRKPVLLMLLAMMSTTAAAAETFLSNPNLDDLMDGDVAVARMGQRGPAVHMSVMSPAGVHHGAAVNASAGRQSAVMPEVYLSVRMPW